MSIALRSTAMHPLDVVPKKMTPQEKKRLSLKKDFRNDYGENDKSSRKAIRTRKRWVNRSYRREIKQNIDFTVEGDLQSRVEDVQRKPWKKLADTPLGEHILDKSNRRIHQDLEKSVKNDTNFYNKFEEFLRDEDLSDLRIKAIIKQVRSSNFLTYLDLSAKDINILEKFIKHKKG